MTDLQAAQRRHAAHCDRKALHATSPHVSQWWRRRASEHRLAALIAAYRIAP